MKKNTDDLTKMIIFVLHILTKDFHEKESVTAASCSGIAFIMP